MNPLKHSWNCYFVRGCLGGPSRISVKRSAFLWGGSFSRRFRQPVTKDVRAESLRRCRTSCQHRQYFSLEKKVEPFSEEPFGLRLIGPPDVASPMWQPVTAEKLSRL